MKLEFLTEMMDNLSEGTYAGVSFSSDTVKALGQYCKDNNIPNSTPANELHCTLLYSRRYLPNYEPQGEIDPPYEARPYGFSLWKSQTNMKNILVLRINCPALVMRHVYLMREHEATYDFPEYVPHITLSYDAGLDFDVNSLPAFLEDIEITNEYQYELVD